VCVCVCVCVCVHSASGYVILWTLCALEYYKIYRGQQMLKIAGENAESEKWRDSACFSRL